MINTELQQKALNIIMEVKKVIIGKDDVIKKILTSFLARGHILLDDIPGVGKTTMALAFSKAMSLDYQRLQFTPDVLPTDVTGFSIYNKQTDSFNYKPGAAICNLFLADEINRTSSKTQSALLEVMEEGKVTVDGVTREKTTCVPVVHHTVDINPAIWNAVADGMHEVVVQVYSPITTGSKRSIYRYS